MLEAREAEARDPAGRAARHPAARGAERRRHLSLVPGPVPRPQPQRSGSRLSRAIRAAASWTAVGPPS
jgi:hypothetical protein